MRRWHSSIDGCLLCAAPAAVRWWHIADIIDADDEHVLMPTMSMSASGGKRRTCLIGWPMSANDPKPTLNAHCARCDVHAMFSSRVSKSRESDASQIHRCADSISCHRIKRKRTLAVKAEELEHFGWAFRKQMEVEMKEEIARLRVHHMEDLRPIAKSLETLASQVKRLPQWEAELNPANEKPPKQFAPPYTAKRKD